MISIWYSTILNQNIKKAQEEATNKILLEKQKEIPNLNKIKELYNQLEDIQNYKKQGTIIRSKEKSILEQEQPNKHFFKQEKSQQKKKTITELEITKNNKTNIITENFDILKECKQYYTNLYTNFPMNPKQQNSLLENLKNETKL